MALDSLTHITIDVADPLHMAVVKAVEEDIRSRFVEITLVENGQPLEIPAGATGTVGMKRPNGTYVLYDEDEDGNAAVTIRAGKSSVQGQLIHLAAEFFLVIIICGFIHSITRFLFLL